MINMKYTMCVYIYCSIREEIPSTLDDSESCDDESDSKPPSKNQRERKEERQNGLTV